MKEERRIELFLGERLGDTEICIVIAKRTVFHLRMRLCLYYYEKSLWLTISTYTFAAINTCECALFPNLFEGTNVWLGT